MAKISKNHKISCFIRADNHFIISYTLPTSLFDKQYRIFVNWNFILPKHVTWKLWNAWIFWRIKKAIETLAVQFIDIYSSKHKLIKNAKEFISTIRNILFSRKNDKREKYKKESFRRAIFYPATTKKKEKQVITLQMRSPKGQDSKVYMVEVKGTLVRITRRSPKAKLNM